MSIIDDACLACALSTRQFLLCCIAWCGFETETAYESCDCVNVCMYVVERCVTWGHVRTEINMVTWIFGFT